MNPNLEMAVSVLESKSRCVGDFESSQAVRNELLIELRKRVRNVVETANRFDQCRQASTLDGPHGSPFHSVRICYSDGLTEAINAVRNAAAAIPEDLADEAARVINLAFRDKAIPTNAETETE